jgi:transmembrane sensor
MDKELLNRLTEKINNGIATDQEFATFNSYMNALAKGNVDWTEQRPGGSEAVKKELWEGVAIKTEATPVRRLYPWKRIAVAASVLIMMSIGLYFYSAKTDTNRAPLATNQDIAPGKNGATLTLADGSKISINDALVGNIATQTGVKISKNAAGQILYEVLDADQEKVAYNTLTTTRGEQTQVLLPDGTLVYLNAESSLRYPTSFKNADKRLVTLTGEGYFEVAKDKSHPFLVSTISPSGNKNGQSIEVLGTHFNVQAYADENSIKTTLLEGSVRIHSDGKQVMLKPGNQARNTVGQLTVSDIGKAGMLRAVAWKEGRFNFQDANLRDVMKQLSRWYDIEVVYEQGVPDIEFIGEIEKSLPLSQVLKGLKMSNVHFRIDNNRRVIVSP